MGPNLRRDHQHHVRQVRFTIQVGNEMFRLGNRFSESSMTASQELEELRIEGILTNP